MSRLQSVCLGIACLAFVGNGTAAWAEIQGQQFAIEVNQAKFGTYNGQLNFGALNPPGGNLGSMSVVFDNQLGTAQLGQFNEIAHGAFLSIAICQTNNGEGGFAVFVVTSTDLKQAFPNLARFLPPATVAGAGTGTSGSFSFIGTQNGGPP